MPKFNTHRLVQHAPQKMFDLVADVEKYPEFLPMCEELSVRTSKEIDGKTLLIADMTVGYKLIRETFTTRVFLDPGARQIDVQYIDGPFRYLENRWSFHAAADSTQCDIEFFIDYEFKNRMLGILMGSMFDLAFRKFTEAFEQRADEIYSEQAKI